jgi:hypothetical protein
MWLGETIERNARGGNSAVAADGPHVYPARRIRQAILCGCEARPTIAGPTRPAIGFPIRRCPGRAAKAAEAVSHRPLR